MDHSELPSKTSSVYRPESDNPTPLRYDTKELIEPPAVVDISKGRRWIILSIMCLSMFVDVMSSSAFLVFTADIAKDLNVMFSQQSWIVTSYAVTFASFLLFWGRVSDLFSARLVFGYGFMAFGVLNLALSFLIDQYSFFILRALSGIAGAALVPSAYRLIASNFPKEERSRAYTIYGMTGSLANASGVIIAGVFAIIPNEGQMRSWRWFFRMVTAISIPAGISALVLVPRRRIDPLISTGGRLRRMDPVGLASMLGSVLLLIISLTFGATYGWGSPSFIVPIILSALLFPFFFWWETRLADGDALIPPSLWRLPNFTVLIIFALIILGWWVTNFLAFIELFYSVNGESIILASVRTLPEAVAAGAISIAMLIFPSIISRPKIPILIGCAFAGTASLLWTQAPDLVGAEYWKFIFPGMVIGSTGMQIALLASMIGVMLAAPPDQAGVVGATLQTSMQISVVVALSIQAGLFTTHPGGVHNYRNVQASFYFELGWVVLWGIGFGILYKPSKNPDNKDLEAAVAL